MTTLKEATRAAHDAAETTEWAKLLISGKITIDQYAHYLYNLLEIHDAIESRNVITMPQILRVPAIAYDIETLQTSVNPGALDSTWDYIKHLRNLPEEKLWCHIYCHYLGYMYGGQMIKKAVPFTTTMLDFEDRPECVAYVRSHLENADHAEAVHAFERATIMFNDLWTNYSNI